MPARRAAELRRYSGGRRPQGSRQSRSPPEEIGLILLVDDDPVALRSVRRILESAGLRVEALSDPQQALDHRAEQDPELILATCTSKR